VTSTWRGSLRRGSNQSWEARNRAEINSISIEQIFCNKQGDILICLLKWHRSQNKQNQLKYAVKHLCYFKESLQWIRFNCIACITYPTSSLVNYCYLLVDIVCK
jgi:hypothetical protein